MPRKSPKTASQRFEQVLWRAGCRSVIGVDEAGRGTWAGPVSAAMVCLPADQPDLPKLLEGVYDSKRKSARARTRLVEIVKHSAAAWGIGWAEADEIDHLGIVPATCRAIERAIEQAKANFPGFAPDYMLMDSIKCQDLHLTFIKKFRPIVKGDQKSLTIAAASILAKVWRDEHMLELDSAYPQYGFAAHKGYGTAKHRAALIEYGVCPLHRRSFKPMSQLVPSPELE